LSRPVSAAFDERHVVVTGGGSGIGAAIAARFADAGALVTIIGRDPLKLRASARRIGAYAVTADVTVRDEVEAAVSGAVAARGAVHILVNSAGAAEAAPFSKTDEALWDRMLAVNLSGTYLCARAVAGAMLSAGDGRIVNIASTAALTGYAYVSAYCAAKHGVLGLTRALAVEFAQRGVTVNAVCPGYTDTELVERSLDNIVASTGRNRDEAMAELLKVNPQRRLITPDEVAEAVLWLCGPHAASVTGQAIAIAGGEVM
jgi:NAD(P)-dependent dehydrogenase (short-subunit alcohol dehydrogenase family)